MTIHFGDNTSIASGSGLGGLEEADQWRITSNFTINNSDTQMNANWERVDSNFEKIGTGMSQSSGVFTFPSTGKWWCRINIVGYENELIQQAQVEMRFSTDSGSNYKTTMTTTYFTAFHNEAGNDQSLTYETGRDLAQSTSFKTLINEVGNDNDQSCSGFLHLFNPSSTTFVKHFICDVNSYFNANYNTRALTAGYFNTTSAIDALQFKMSSGNIDSGTITLYGIN